MTNISKLNKKSNVLNDIRKNGKSNDWKGKKQMNEDYSDILKKLHYLKAKNVSTCADTLLFTKDEKGFLELQQTWFCKSRLCPVCAWRRSILFSSQVSDIVSKAIDADKSGRWLFLTLTTKNTKTARELGLEIRKMNNGLRSLLKRKKVAKNLNGFMRATEVTVNKKNRTYNQHMHVLLFVKSTFFKNKDNYIKQQEWTEMWQEVMKLDYKPVVNVKAIKEDSKKGIKGAVYEVAKYPVKAIDYLNGTDIQNRLTVDDLEKALNRKRLTAFGGLLKKIQKELNMQDVDDKETDLVDIEDIKDSEEDEYKKENEEEPKTFVVAKWNQKDKNYYTESFLATFSDMGLYDRS